MPLPIVSVLLVASICASILAAPLTAAILLILAAAFEIGLFIAGGFGGLGS